MTSVSGRISCVVLGEQSLLIQCCEVLLARRHEIRAVVAENRRISQWCEQHRIPCYGEFDALRDAPEATSFDYLFSITNLRMLPGWLLERPQQGAINFHDGPLPRYAGLNAPVWAIINNEAEHGITWHRMELGADTGPIITQRRFAIAKEETVFGLNAQCYQAGLEAFGELVEAVERGALQAQPQDLSQRSYFGLGDRPPAAATLDWRRPAVELERLVRALDFGPYPNPVILPRVDLGSSMLLAREAEQATANEGVPAGTIQACDAESVTVRCGEGALRIRKLTDLSGDAIDVAVVLQQAGLQVGAALPQLAPELTQSLTSQVTALVKHEDFWRRRIQRAEPAELPFANKFSESGLAWSTTSLGVADDALIAAVTLVLARLNGKREFALAYVPAAVVKEPEWFTRFFAPVVPVPVSVDPQENFAQLTATVASELAASERKVSYLNDLAARVPEVRAASQCAEYPVRIVRCVSADEALARRFSGQAALTVVVPEQGAMGVLADRSRLDAAALERLLDTLRVVVEQVQADAQRAVKDYSVITSADRKRLMDWVPPFDEARKAALPTLCTHQLFEQQVLKTPTRDACLFEGDKLTYQQLNSAANRLALYLQRQGVKRGDLVGVLVGRSLDMLVALYAVHKAGAAYVPLDPVYPRDRLSYMIEDADLPAVITQRMFAEIVPAEKQIVLEDIAGVVESLPDDNLNVSVATSDLAYVIYTSGSTGKPKGVMIEHGNVVNFFEGMDERLDAEPGVWLAVTSISFDISVLELFWTLARGFTIVLYADAVRQKVRRVRAPGKDKKIEFGFFYWNVANDESEYDDEKYRLLLEGAKYADTHGFNAVWTPERHFEAFGGLFPNPAVTSAALATMTRNVALRAGSCVVPLHSPIRIAEEWAVVDNLSNGRVGISIAAGWAPPDFAIRPESFANAKQVMFDSAEIVKRLWRGERVAFPGPKGEVQVRTLPRPIQKELPIWVTTAGNIESFVQAGKLGANLLTHLLGQTVEEVAEKVRAYRKAWAEAGHAGQGTVTLMLHTFVGPDAETVERVVRQPLKDYLKSAMFLVKAAAWQFPTFKKMSEEQGKTLDEFFATISSEDMDGLLEFAFQRYFHTSGLFGTPEQCLKMVDKVEAADVDEIACLIDFGIKTDVVLEHLPYLNELRSSAQDVLDSSDEDFSLPALFQRHPITHFQCTPSMATMLVSDPATRSGLESLRQMMVGGEAFPPELARTLKSVVRGRVTNMYGPTETTIWSAVGDVGGDTPLPANNVSIGTALKNQTLYVLDEHQQPLPPGIAGELVIGGAGVVRGYWRRPEMTNERFLPDPFATAQGARMYRTGDVARFLPDGRLECLGRVDHQVKIRGYRVELGEIEALLRSHPDVVEGAVVLREDVPGDQRLVAYTRSAAGVEASPDKLKEWLRQQLPEFMVPSVFVSLSEMPLTPNGKIDRKALPAPKVAEVKQSDYVAPSSDAEAMIMDIWQRALGVSKIGIRDNFFDIGGHSLLVVQVLAELRGKVAKPIQMTDLFRHTTIVSLAQFISSDTAPAEAVNRGKARADARRAVMAARRGVT